MFSNSTSAPGRRIKLHENISLICYPSVGLSIQMHRVKLAVHLVVSRKVDWASTLVNIVLLVIR